MNDESRRPAFTRVLVALLLCGALAILIDTVLGLKSFRDVAYPDSATLLRIGDVVRDGHVYPDSVNKPPYYLSLYGPLFYLVLAIPFRVAQMFGADIVLVERLTVLAFFCTSIVLVFFISRKISSSTRAAWFSVLFVLSPYVIGSWTTQIRSDFLGLTLVLSGFYCFLLLQDRPYACVLSAIPSGLAPLSKQTFIALPIAIVSWLILRRRYKEAFCWGTAFALVAGGGFAVIWMHDPFMREHLAVLGHPLLEFRGAFRLASDAVSQPMIPFAIVGALLLFWKRTSEELLLPFYWLAALLIGCATVPQVGGGLNYFWESLWISAILAGPAVLELERIAGQTARPYRVLVYILLVGWFAPLLHLELWDFQKDYQDVKAYQARKADFQRFASFVKGHRFLSTYPDLTVLSTNPELPDPGLNTILEIGGHWSYRPVITQLDDRVFEFAVITPSLNETFRGVHFWDAGMVQSLHAQYRLACVFQDMDVWLPIEDTARLLPRFEDIGCKPADSSPGSPHAIAAPQ
jgi:hypothetical protein